jgi:LmbE family N-acetylglucosaminyl deacetylase
MWISRKARALRLFLAGGVIALLGLCSFLGVYRSCPGSHTGCSDTGNTGLEQQIRKLRTTARLMYTTAHPDDENGGVLALEARGEGADVMLLTLTRGEGGQNKTGSELFDELGVLRTLELLAADRCYGVEQRFTRVADFGFSKSAEESLEKWRAREIALGDMVRAIRAFHPDVLVSRFEGSPRDGHGNHQAAGILTPQAFRAAADPKMFPEQIHDGLEPWQVSKLYIEKPGPENGVTLRLDPGAYDPVLGTSYVRLALEGLEHQMSQGAGGYIFPLGHHYVYFKLADSRLPGKSLTAGREQSFFEGLDTTLAGLADRLGKDEGKVPYLRPLLRELMQKVDDAAADMTPADPSRAAAPLLAGLDVTEGLIKRLQSSSLAAPEKNDLLLRLAAKRNQYRAAANLALGLALEAAASASGSEEPTGQESSPRSGSLTMAVPGETFLVTARLLNGSRLSVEPKSIALNLPAGWQWKLLSQDLRALAANDTAYAQFQVTVPQDAAYLRPYWHRGNTQDAIYTIDQPQYLGSPLPPYPVQVRALYAMGNSAGEIRATAHAIHRDPLYGSEETPLAVGPPFSVSLEPPLQVVRTDAAGPSEVTVAVRNNLTGTEKATLELSAPAGWKVEPPSQKVELAGGGETTSFRFSVTRKDRREGMYLLKAALSHEGKSYAEGFDVVHRHDLGTFYFYRPAQQVLKAVEVKLPAKQRVGYIMGAGDNIPAVLKQLGINLEVLSSTDLESEDLNRFDTIVLGIRAYDVRRDVRDNNRRLLGFVAQGGTLVVQYNQDVAAFNAGRYTPFPATAGTQRVSVEDSPVEVLRSQDSLFHYPNEISARDFEGWVQERGAYFMSYWDPRFEPLLSCHDPGEPALQGGLLRATYGRGLYIYTGYAFFRQVPAGVSGAIRLFVNIISARAQSPTS